MDICDLGGGSGPPRLHTGGANIIWVKKKHDTRGERLQIATYNVRTTLLKDEHVQVLEEVAKPACKHTIAPRKCYQYNTISTATLQYHSRLQELLPTSSQFIQRLHHPMTKSYLEVTSRGSRIFLKRGPLSCVIPGRRDSVGGG